MSLLGAGLAILSAVSIVFIFLIEAITGRSNPYLGIFTYMVYPALLVLGLIFIPVGVLLDRRRRMRTGEASRYPVIDLNQGRTRSAFLFIVVATIFLLGLVSTISYQAYHYTESVTFCGEVCHSVMEPEYTAYKDSPHARVTCAECHVGEGAGWYVRSKLSGAYQIYSVLFEKYPRPVPTPVHSLRPAQDTCEQCHWPEKFFGAQLKVTTRFAHDEKNTVRQIRTLLKTGGGSPSTGINTGIHWHMNIDNEVWYGASDPQRQKIPWVRIKDREGKVTDYYDRTVKLTDEQLKKLEIRKMDCIDCHNRPSHIFRDPDSAVDLALLGNRIDASLPYIKREAVRALSASYAGKQEAREGIAAALREFYAKRYPKAGETLRDSIDKAIAEVQRIYQTNIFPEMKVDWRTHPDNIGHTLFPGCFRCHEGNHVSNDGRVVSKDCQLCHTIIGQEVNLKNPTQVAAVETFAHPWPLAGKHAQLSCSQCHVRGRGLSPDCTTCHTHPSGVPMANMPCGVCHLKEQEVKPLASCESCHPNRAELHLKPTHAAVGCTTCHAPHQWMANKRENCYSCHPDKREHYPNVGCESCHAFRPPAKAAGPK